MRPKDGTIVGLPSEGSEYRTVAGAAARRRAAVDGWMDRARLLAKGWLDGLAAGPQKRSRLLSIVERMDLGPKRSLWIVACGERRFLVAGGTETIGGMVELAPVGASPSGRIPVMTPVLWMAE